VLEFARTAEAIGATSSTLEKSGLLAAYLRDLEADDLRLAAVYMTGLPFGRAERRVLKAGWATLSRAVERLSGLDPSQLGEVYLKHSDMGDWAQEVLEGRTAPKPTALQEVAEALDAIETAPGAEAKQAQVEVLLARLTPLEAKYVVKILSGDLRIGLREGLVEAGIARAFEVEGEQVRRTHMLTGDIGETALRCKRRELGGGEVSLFQPIRYMLASPVETATEAIERVGGEAWTEEKYDGVRCQLHVGGGRGGGV
jgi:DNA ligase-1